MAIARKVNEGMRVERVREGERGSAQGRSHATRVRRVRRGISGSFRRGLVPCIWWRTLVPKGGWPRPRPRPPKAREHALPSR